jgi:hypothetical protein
MGASGPLVKDRKWVLSIDIPRPKTAAETEKIWKIVADLQQKFGASVVSSVGSTTKTKTPSTTKTKTLSTTTTKTKTPSTTKTKTKTPSTTKSKGR